MIKKIIAAALAAAVLLAAGGLLFGLHRIGETTISAGPEPAAPEEVQPAEPEEPSVPEQPEKEPEEAEPVQTQTPVPEAVQTEKPCIVIDAGHQLNADYGKEPVGPESTELKTRVSAGTTGVSTGIPEYELNLAVSLLLQQELTARLYGRHDADGERRFHIQCRARADREHAAGRRVHPRPCQRKRKRRRQRDHDHLHDAVEPV